MDFKFSDLGGRRIERDIVHERVVDAVSGYELAAERLRETSETVDGVIETRTSLTKHQLECPHTFAVGGLVVRCEICSARKGSPAYVCPSCSVICPMKGVGCCLRCSVLGPNMQRYSPEGYQQAQAMGLFDAYKQPSSPSPISRLVNLFVYPFRVLKEWW